MRQKNICLLIALLVCNAFCFGETDRLVAFEPKDRPNVLFIAVDDLNDWIEPLGGHPQVKTPHLNRLAERCTLFTNAHCQAPICNPSRVSLLTGTLPSSTGIYFLTPSLRQCESTRQAITIPEHFSNHGYATFGGGKIFHGPSKEEFDEYAGSFGGFGPRPETNINCKHVHPLWDWGAFPEQDQQMPDYKLADWAINIIEQKHDQPWFLAVGFYRPHVPLYVPSKWFELYDLETIELPAQDVADDLADISTYARDLTYSAVAPRHHWIVENNQWRRAVQAYLASISFVDAQIGRVLNALDASPYTSETIIVLWSDHGFQLGTKQRWGKRSLWEASTGVPLMIGMPGQQQPSKCSQPVGLIDLYPTLIDLCELNSVSGLEGHSLLPLLEDPQYDWPYPAITTFGQNNHAVRTNQWRYIVYANGMEELYDHNSDTSEYRNVINEDGMREVADELKKFLPQVNHPMAPGSKHLDARPGSEPDIDGEPNFGKPAKPKK